jgi:hypothetical protein
MRAKFGIRALQIGPLTICEFWETRRSKGRTFLTGINKIALNLKHAHFQLRNLRYGVADYAICNLCKCYNKLCRSRWPRGLRRGSAAAGLLGLRVRIPPRAWMSVCCECCVLSGRGLCDGLITRPEESYLVWCV